MAGIRKVQPRAGQIKEVTKEEAQGLFEDKAIPEVKVDMEGGGGEHNHDLLYLGIDATAVDSSKLGGQLPSYYAPASVLGDIETILASI